MRYEDIGMDIGFGRDDDNDMIVYIKTRKQTIHMDPKTAIIYGKALASLASNVQNTMDGVCHYEDGSIDTDEVMYRLGASRNQ